MSDYYLYKFAAPTFNVPPRLGWKGGLSAAGLALGIPAAVTGGMVLATRDWGGDDEDAKPRNKLNDKWYDPQTVMSSVPESIMSNPRGPNRKPDSNLFQPDTHAIIPDGRAVTGGRLGRAAHLQGQGDALNDPSVVPMTLDQWRRRRAGRSWEPDAIERRYYRSPEYFAQRLRDAGDINSKY